MYMYDVTSHESLYAISELHSIFADRGSEVANEVVIVGNKIDLASEAGIFHRSRRDSRGDRG
jgi:GTP1/Obg family GTP-binding protein